LLILGGLGTTARHHQQRTISRKLPSHCDSFHVPP
jgi:hypothetical protein